MLDQKHADMEAVLSRLAKLEDRTNDATETIANLTEVAYRLVEMSRHVASQHQERMQAIASLVASMESFTLETHQQGRKIAQITLALGARLLEDVAPQLDI